MNIKKLNTMTISTIILNHIDQVKCLECCKYYMAPKTATCGHTLCHSCWIGKRNCPYCAKPIERQTLKHNLFVQSLTEHIHALGEAFEDFVQIKLDELLDIGEADSIKDPTKNVKDWLASSQNHFSAPALSSELSEQNSNPLVISSKVLVHTDTKKTSSPEKIVQVPQPQDDWDKIELLSSTEDDKKTDNNAKQDVELLNFDDDEYCVKNPRRSSRNKEMKDNSKNHKTDENNSLGKQSSKDSSGEIDKKISHSKQTWNNVKRMRKEFSRLNKKNRNKLNVSIEMCKKNPNTAKPNNLLPQKSSSQLYEIDENTPNHKHAEQHTMDDIPQVQSNGVEPKSIKEYSNYDLSTHNAIIKEKNTATQALIKRNNESTQKIKSKPINTNTTTKPDQERLTECREMKKTYKMPFYKKGALHRQTLYEKDKTHNIVSNSTGNDDIEISIKVGNTITNIVIKKKNEIELKLNTDREIQTSLGPHNIIIKNKEISSQTIDTKFVSVNVGNKNEEINNKNQPKLNTTDLETKYVSKSYKTISEKKNTDSADTATAQYEITESVEKELSKEMACDDLIKPIQPMETTPPLEKPCLTKSSQKPATHPDYIGRLDDLDIFESVSVKEGSVHLLKDAEYAPSEILVPTLYKKDRTQKGREKRYRECNTENNTPKSKKSKLNNDHRFDDQVCSNQNLPDSEAMNYDSIMGKVFANIDADIEDIRKIENINKNTYTLSSSDKKVQTDVVKNTQTQNKIMSQANKTINFEEYNNQKDSENIFSVCVDKDEDSVAPLIEKIPQPNIEDFLTPVLCRNLESSGEALVMENNVHMVMDDDNSDKSVYEETPQKATSFSKPRQKSNGTNKDNDESKKTDVQKAKLELKPSTFENTRCSKDLTDTVNRTSNMTVIEATAKKNTLETPLTINNFVDQIKHKSTPVARKSLNFEDEQCDDTDPEQTLCPTIDDVAKTTQEKEFMSRAFENTPKSVGKSITTKKLGLHNIKYCIAGSCLSPAETLKLKILCNKYKWSYSDKYTKDLTHLVVGVDEENKSQRSVKYMCALASSKWIVSSDWATECLQSNTIVSEELYEALDSTGEAGPRRSRLASTKIFQGFTFFCMEPFSVLDVETLKNILKASGGKVVKDPKEVRVTNDTLAPALLLAEPEHTQEDRFIYLAMELGIVPVNFEWVLNCLGSYTLCSIQDLLLCPTSLLPKVTEKWPQELLVRDED